jgi:hypothetical protein
MRFDLILSKGFKTPALVTVTCTVTKKQGPRQRMGHWAIKKEHLHLFRLIAQTTNGIMYSYYNYSRNLPWICCYNDQSPHNPIIHLYDPAIAFAILPAPLDDSDQFKHLTKGSVEIVNPANATMKDFEGRWHRWI